MVVQLRNNSKAWPNQWHSESPSTVNVIYFCDLCKMMWKAGGRQTAFTTHMTDNHGYSQES